jgi:hypothetical protein
MNCSSILMKNTKFTNKFMSGETDASTSYMPEPSRKELKITCVETFNKPLFLSKEYPSEPVKSPMYPLRRGSTCFIPVLWVSEKYTNVQVILILGSI